MAAAAAVAAVVNGDRAALLTAVAVMAQRFANLGLAAPAPEIPISATPGWSLTDVVGHVTMEANRYRKLANTVLSLTVEVVKRTDKIAGFLVLPRRWVVERTFGWITKHRRCVRDYETPPEHHEAMVHIAMIMMMSRRLARTRDR